MFKSAEDRYNKIFDTVKAMEGDGLKSLIGYIEFHYPEVVEAKWTQAYINDLPDSSFLLVRRPVKDKARDRALPVKDKNGKVDLPHLRNALARVGQVQGFSSAAVNAAKRKLKALAKKHLPGYKADDKVNRDDLQKVLDGISNQVENNYDALSGIFAKVDEKIDSVIGVVEEKQGQIDAKIKEKHDGLVDSIASKMLEMAEIKEDEVEKTKEFLSEKDDETLNDLLSDLNEKSNKAIEPVGEISDPGAVFQESGVEIGEGTEPEDVVDTKQYESYDKLIDLVKQGDKKAQRYLEEEIRKVAKQIQGHRHV